MDDDQNNVTLHEDYGPNSPSNFRILTYNCGLLRLRMFCSTVFSNPPHVPVRFEHLASHLRSSGADIIALQEIYEKDHFEDLFDEIRDLYPYVVRETPRQAPHKFHNGLAILSKHKVSRSGILRHRDVPVLERWMGCKAFLWAYIHTPLGKMFVTNMHTTAGGGMNPERADGMRERELDECIDMCKQAIEEGVVQTFLLGDLNLGPEASAGNYKYIQDNGFTDCVTAVADGEQMMTWDPVNPLNATGPHSYCPPQRCDHIFLNSDCSELKPVSAHMVFKEPVASTRRGMKLTLSDHYGIIVNLEKQAAKDTSIE